MIITSLSSGFATTISVLAVAVQIAQRDALRMMINGERRSEIKVHV
jgi:ABC-type nickel/cobalt efflux system permease component RcnA